jgi:Aspartyl/Asparaginyl beta-hydroxylase
MDNFFRLAKGVNFQPLLVAIHRQPELWDQNTLRTKHPKTAHGEVNDIWLMFNEVGGDVANDLIVKPYPAFEKLPQARPFIFDLMKMVEGVTLGRVIITKLGPGKKITPHVDGGAPASYFSRYQLVLQSLPGALFTIGDETVNFESGEVWLIDNKKEHSVVNNSRDDRIVMIVDIRS